MSKCCCSASEGCCPQPPKKSIAIDFLYLDTSICERCQDTEKALDEAVSSVTVVLNAAGYEVKVNKVNIATKELAIQYQFISSPTIRVNGNDIAVELRESACEDCGNLCGNLVDCRTWVYNGVEYTAPPKELIVDAILREVYQAKQGEPVCEPYQLPMNLKTFFTSKTHKDEADIQMKEGNGL